MNCEEARALIELEPGDSGAAAQAGADVHAEGCAACRAFAESRGRERAALRAKLPRFGAPPDLEGRVRARLDAAGAEAPRGFSAAYGRLAAALVLGVLLGTAGTYGALRARSADAQAGGILSSHLRSLVAENRLVDVASSDHHTVKPWFAGKVDFAPPVVDLAGAGFPLVGGRVDYVGGQRVAVLVYRHGAHVVSLFVGRSLAGGGRPAEERGYTVVGWAQDGLDFRAISDAGPDEMATFARLVRAP